MFANTDWYLFNFRLGLARFLRDGGAEIVFVSPPGEFGSKLEAEGFRWISVDMNRLSLNPLREIRLVMGLYKIFRQIRPDVVHNFTIKCVIYGGLVARIAKVPAVVNAIAGMGFVFSSDRILAQMLRPIVLQLIRIAAAGKNARLVLQNSHDKDVCLRLGLAKIDRTVLIESSGVNTSQFFPRPRIVGGEGSDRPFRALFAARLIWDKGVGVYVDAAQILRKRSNSLQFLIAGTPDVGNPGSVAKEHITQWEDTGVVTMLGHVSNMAELMASIDVAVLPTSYGEGIPRFLIEASASAIPVVATDVPGCRDVVEDGVTGFLVPTNSPLELAEAIWRLASSAELRKSMGAAGRERVVQRFDERLVFQKTAALYKSLE